MKRKVKITLTLDVEYPDVEKETKQLSKDFDRWLKDWAKDNASNEVVHILPVLFKKFKNKSSEECVPYGKIDVKIERSKEVILHKEYKNKYLQCELKKFLPFILDW